MFLLTKPSAEFIRQYLEIQRDKAFSYSEVGASYCDAPRGYILDHSRIRIGSGRQDYLLAKEAVRAWKMFDFSWLQLCWPDSPIAEGTTVAVLVRHLGFWSLNSCRIVYVMEEEDDTVHKFGFAYGTLDDHAERGEERFLVQWDRKDDSVCYDVLAFSKPNSVLATLAYPLTRALQKKFAIDSQNAMRNAVRS